MRGSPRFHTSKVYAVSYYLLSLTDDIVAASHEIQHGRLNKDAFVAAGANEAAGFSVVLIRFNCDTRTKRGVVRDAESRGGNEAWTPIYVRR